MHNGRAVTYADEFLRASLLAPTSLPAVLNGGKVPSQGLENDLRYAERFLLKNRLARRTGAPLRIGDWERLELTARGYRLARSGRSSSTVLPKREQEYRQICEIGTILLERQEVAGRRATESEHPLRKFSHAEFILRLMRRLRFLTGEAPIRRLTPTGKLLCKLGYDEGYAFYVATHTRHLPLRSGLRTVTPLKLLQRISRYAYRVRAFWRDISETDRRKLLPLTTYEFIPAFSRYQLERRRLEESTEHLPSMELPNF